MVLPLLVLVAMVLIAGTLSRTGRTGAVLLALASVLWLQGDQRFEGKVLWAVLPTHGLTVGDLVGLAGILVAIWHWFDAPRLRRGAGADHCGRDEPDQH